MSPDEIKQLGIELLEFDHGKIDKLMVFISKFPDSGKTPRGMKRQKSHLESLKRSAQMYTEYGLISDNIKAVFSYYDEEMIGELVDKFIAPEKVEKIKVGRITFDNKSQMSQERFKSTSQDLFEFLKGFKGYHAMTLSKPLKVVFQPSSNLKSKAVYKGDLDEIWIRESASRNMSDKYGGLKYILAHELGHRFERLHGLPEGFREIESYTTPYSRTDSFAGSEAFAELFAISHFTESYDQYKSQVKIFVEQMNSSFVKNKELEMT